MTIPADRFEIVRTAGRKSERRVKALRRTTSHSITVLQRQLRNTSTAHDRDIMRAVISLLEDTLNHDTERSTR